MEWESDTQILFTKIVEQMPQGFRPSVEPLILEASEKRCLERNGAYISNADVVLGIFDIIPEAFKPIMVEDLTALGIDVERYIELKDIKDRLKVSWEKLERGFHPGNIHFAMYLTDKCNQRCLYCAADDLTLRSELTTKQWTQIIQNVELGLRKQGRHACFVWFGGEPTLRNDIGEIMKFCSDNDYIHALITNGVQFDDDFAKMCKEYNISHIFVSFDSVDPEKNDRLRGFKNSLHYAKRAIDLCLKYGIFVCSSITVIKDNVNELEELKALSEEWGSQPYFRCVVKQNRAAEHWGEIGLSVEEYKKMYDFKFKHAIETIRNGQAGTLPAYEIYDMMPFMEKPKSDKELAAIEWGVGCLACRTMMGIGIDGTIFPAGYPTNLTLGNALEDDFEEVLNSQLYKDIRDRKRIKGKCASCHHLEQCGGGCRVTAEYITGDFFGSFPFCWHENDHEHETIESKKNEIELLE